MNKNKLYWQQARILSSTSEPDNGKFIWVLPVLDSDFSELNKRYFITNIISDLEERLDCVRSSDIEFQSEFAYDVEFLTHNQLEDQ